MLGACFKRRESLEGGRRWRIAGKREWLKAYRNWGSRAVSDEWFTKDFDRHRFVVEDLKGGRPFRVCVSGRSFRYELFRIVFVKCEGNECTGGRVEGVKRLPTSPCYKL